MLTERQRALLEALDSIDEPRSAIDLYDIYEDELKPYYESINHLQAGLSYFRKMGFCDNGISEIVDGRTRLTWVLTKLGWEFLKLGVIPGPAVNKEDEITPEQNIIIDENDMDEQSVKALEEALEHSKSPRTIHFVTQPLSERLDIEAIKQELTSMLDRHFSKHEFNIDRIAAKIAALDVIGSSSCIADDLRELLNELAAELQKIQEAA